MDDVIKQETVEPREVLRKPRPLEVPEPATVIDLSSSDSGSDGSDDSEDGSAHEPPGKRPRISKGLAEGLSKKKKLDELGVVLPVGFLDPLSPDEASLLREPISRSSLPVARQGCKQFWKAGDYEGSGRVDPVTHTGGMDHVRVHPKFLHSNATSHKWALGAFAELLDNSLDEVCHGATYVNIDMLENKKDGSRMLLVEDNGGGMDPDKMRECMSLGYSTKSKLVNTIGQYGNGFKTSTMRLGADVIVFTRCRGKDGKSPTQSIGMLSYTFLRSTMKEDIVVPILDYEKGGWAWNKMMRSSLGDWNINVETIIQWSPYSSEADLLQQFKMMKDQGTRIMIYNLWEDDQGELELDFDTDQNDIQLRGVNRDENKIRMAKQYPNSRHFLTYRNSLRSYASILYLRLAPGFQIILRGKEVEHHNIVNDMMLSQEITYRPQPGADGASKDANMVAIVTIGFVKDAKHHIDVQGFNVYHKNRLIKPFWRVWNAAGSDGRGVIGVLEANFVEPAHDKQGFERTTVLSRLEARLVQMQKTYWSTYCDKIGYAPRRQNKLAKQSTDRETLPDHLPQSSFQHSKKFVPPSSGTSLPDKGKLYSQSNQKQERREPMKYSKSINNNHGNGHVYNKGESKKKPTTKFGKISRSSDPTLPSTENVSDNDMHPEQLVNGSSHKASHAQKPSQKDGPIASQTFTANIETVLEHASNGRTDQITVCSQSKASYDNGNEHSSSNSDTHCLDILKEENHELKERLQKKEEMILGDLVRDLQLERERCRSLETQLREAEQKIEEMNKEQEALIDIFSEERNRRDNEEENLRKKLKDASTTIQDLLNKVKLLEKMKSPNSKPGH